MRIAFIIDPPDSLKAYKDSSIAMMRSAEARGHSVSLIESSTLVYSPIHGVCGQAIHIELTQDNGTWYHERARETLPLRAFSAVLMRKDPPFDMEYLTSTWLLARAEAEGARIFNRPTALHSYSEKLSILEFPEFAPRTLVSRRIDVLQAFIDEEKEVILKPLNGMGGSEIFYVEAGDPNRNVILEMLTHAEHRTIMAQRYLPQIKSGDKRILIIGGRVVPYALARIPKAGETRGNLAAGGRGVAKPLSPRDSEIANTLAPILLSRGILLAGLDVIGEHLTEINITSPTCMVEITEQTGFDVAGSFMESLETLCAH